MNVDFLETNLAPIRAHSPAIADRIRNAATAPFSIEVLSARNGSPTLRVGGETGCYLHSRYAPEEEAARIVAATDPDADLIVLGGFGLGYLAEALLSRCPQASLVLVECSPQLLRTAFTTRDLLPLLEGGRFDFVLTERIDDVTMLLEGRSTRRINMVIHRPSADLFPEFYLNLKNVLHSFINSKEVNIATLSRFERLWTRNLLRNRSLFAAAPGVVQWKGSAAGVPAFIIGAGPSLAASLPMLAEAGKRGLLIAVDTVYKVLLAHGIDPHVVVAVDPQLVNARFFQGIRRSRAVLVADAAVYPALFRLFPGRCLLSAVPFPFAAYFEETLGKKGALSSGGSVSTTAFDLAVQMGCGPITLLGQDLSYSGKRIHINGTTGEERWEISANRITPGSARLGHFLRANKTVRISASGNGGEVWSDRKFLTFLWWFERRIADLPPESVYNATEGGARIRGTMERPLPQVLAALPEREVLLPALPETIPAGMGTLAAGLAQFTAYLADAERQSDQAARACRKLLESRLPDREQRPLYRELDEADEFLRGTGPWARLLSSTLQRVIHTVNEGFALEGDGAAPQDRDGVLRQSRALYEGIGGAARELRAMLARYMPDLVGRLG